MFGQNVFYFVEFDVKPGKTQIAKDIVRAEFVSLAETESEMEDYAWFEREDGRRFFQVASYRTTEAAIRHHETAQGTPRLRRLMQVCEVKDFKLFGGTDARSTLITSSATHFTEFSRHNHEREDAFGSNYFYIVEFQGKEGRSAEIKEMVTEEYTPLVAKNDPEIEEYVWFVNDRQDRFIQIASYRSPEGVIHHNRLHLGTDRVARLFTLCELDHIKIFGCMTPELAALYESPQSSRYIEFARALKRTSKDSGRRQD